MSEKQPKASRRKFLKGGAVAAGAAARTEQLRGDPEPALVMAAVEAAAAVAADSGAAAKHEGVRGREGKGGVRSSAWFDC